MYWRVRFKSYIEPFEPLSYALWAVRKSAIDDINQRGIHAFASTRKWLEAGFALWYKTLNVHFNRFEQTTAVPKLVALAEGIVLELGSGLGNQIPNFDRDKIEQIYGLEPNEFLIPDLHVAANKYGMQGKYTIILGKAEDTDVLYKTGIVPESLDTVLSIQVLCSVDHPEAVVKELYRLLKPGGKLILWEHHKSHDGVTRIVQNLWNVLWHPLVGGCNINRDIGMVLQSADWQGLDSLQSDEQPWSLLPRLWGTLVKPIRT